MFSNKRKSSPGQRSSSIRHLIFVGVPLMLIIGGLVFSVFIIEFIAPRLVDDNNFELLLYSPNLVLKICDIFDVSETDNFCVEPTIQNADTFRAMLDKNYPREETSYIDIVLKLTQFRSKPTLNCDNPITTDFGWALDNCPPPSKCSNGKTTYTCGFTIGFSGQGIGLDVHFYQDSGIVSGYGVSRPSKSAP